ncbi:MAG: tetratricopeptide repeat protein [Bacteroidetes bacterium]|nr:tetratricopeptide repeat protein [Bacteroidota bacterium]
MRKSFTLFFLFAGLVASAQPEGGAAREGSARDAAQPSVDKARVMDFFQNQEFSEAIEYLSPAVRADSGNVQVLSWAGYAYYMTERMTESGNCFRKVVSLDSNNVSALHYLVLLEIGEAGGGEALEYSQRLLSLQPSRAVWWRTVGECWRRKNKPDSALPYFEKAYELAPKDVKTVAGLADIYIDKRQNARADTIVDYALLQDSNNVSLLKLRVRSAYQVQDYSAVLLSGERLVRLEDPSVVSLTWLALSYYNLQQYPDCIRVCDHMLDMGLELESVYYYQARAYTKLKDYTRSNELLAKALSKAIGNTAEWYFDARADNYEALKDYKSALANSDTSYYLFKSPVTLYNCGRICESELHNLALAKQYYRRYLAVAQPKTEQEKKAYAYVRKRWGKKN